MLFVINFIFLIQSKTNKSTYINDQTVKKVKDETLLLCYATDGTCSHGEVFTDISKLAELIPESTKKINLTIESDINILDLSTIPTTDATFTIIQDSMYNIYLNSIKMDQNPTNIEHLILRSVKLGTGDIQLYANKISFEQNVILFSSASKPNIIFNEQATLIADKDSFEDCFNYVSNKFPATTVNNLADSKFTLEITDSTYNLYIGYAFSPLKFAREKVPNLAFYLSRDAYSSTSSCTIKVTEQTTIESLTVEFDSAIQTGNVVFQGLTDYLNGAQKIGVDFENANGANTIDLNSFPLMKYFAFNGKYEVKNSGGSSPEQGNQICACNDDSLCDNLCGEMTKISFDSLSEKVQEIESDSISIKIVGSNDDNTFPALSLADINGKQTTIVGDGSNPTIQIDCSSQYESDTNSLEISNIVVLCSSLSNNCQISNLKLLDGCTIDSSFNEVSLTVNTLECDVSQLAFKTITIQSSLALTGDASNTESTTKINFEASSTFEYMFHNSATFTGNKLVFNNLEFDLSNVAPTFSISEDSTAFNIIGNDADISTIGADINFGKPINLNSLSISGTWSNTNPSKFFVFDDLSSDLHLHSQNIPLKVQFKSAKKIVLESEEISIIGKLSLSSEYSFSTQNYEISSSLTTNVVFNINELSIKYSNIQFATTNINMIIKTLSIESSYPKPELNLLIDLNGQNTIKIIDKFDSLYSFSYLVTCKITEKLNDARMKDFIDTTHTLIVVNSENTIPQPSDSNLLFDDNAPIGFNNDNFQLKLSENTLVFFCSNSPLDGDIILRYGSCLYDCKGTEINDVSNLEKYISLPNSNVILIIYSSNSQPFDFDKEDISIETLTIKSSSDESKDVIAKFGNNVPILNSENIALTISDNDDFSIEKLFLLKSSSLATNTNLNNIHYLFLDHNSIFTSNINQFPNDIDISIDSPSFTITYTSIGLKLTYKYSDYSTPKVYNIDASKFPKLILSIKTFDSPIIDLEDGVTELNQINSFIIYSSRIYIGSNWNQLSSSTQIKYTLNNPNDDLVVISDSFPFESWDLMYKYPISFSSKLSPYEFHDKLIFNNKKITLNSFEPVNSINYDITLDDVSMSDDSSITCVSKESNNKLTIKKVNIQNGITKLNDVNIKDEITIDSQSQLIEQYNLDDSLTEINLEWDLNHAPLINPSSLQNVNPQNINIIFKGSSIEGKEKEFDEFLSNGVVIIKNINPDNILPNIHFKSDSIKEFNDGENLVLKCQKINDNEIQLIAVKSLFIDPENPSESESSFEIESSSKSESFSESESSSDSESSFKSESLFESENIIHNKSESFSNQESEEPSEKESENSSLSNSSSDKNKNRTIFIAVGTVLGVVVIVIIVIIIIIIKRRSNYENKKDFSQEVQSENNDMMNANIANDEITPSEFTNVLYNDNAKVENEIDPFLRGFEESHI